MKPKEDYFFILLFFSGMTRVDGPRSKLLSLECCELADKIAVAWLEGELSFVHLVPDLAA